MRQIALLTDFGTRDPYVAAMKGVIAARCDAPVADLTHEIAPFDVFEAAWFLRSIIDDWPAGTIFVCVVDPGVGTSRRILAVENGGRLFLAPDNGLLHFVAGGAWSIENGSLFLPRGSTTFHGRDRFAPVAAALANGLPLDELGPRVSDRVQLAYEPPTYGEVVRGTIVSIDRFGNAITDVEASRCGSAATAEPSRRTGEAPVPHRAVLRIGDITIDRFETNYGDAAPGPFLIAGSSGCIEISIANGSAADELQLSRLDRIELCPL